MTVSWVWAGVAQIMFTLNAMQGKAPSPVLNTITYLGYSVPVIAALFLFPKPPALLISRFRAVLDVLVITIGLLFISGATVLHTVWDGGGLQTMEGWSGLAYPIADLAICSVVFTLGMRQRPGNRLTWLCVGSGLVILAVTDTIYVYLLAEKQINLTATPLVIGWMAAPVLTALATLLPRHEPKAKARDLSLPAQLIPYVPVVGAVVVLATGAVADDSFLLIAGVALLVVVMVRQVMIVYENVSLTRDLEAKVAARTVELTTLGSIVTSSTDAIVGLSLDGVITAWNPAAEQLLGYRAADMIGNAPNFLTPAEQEGVKALVARAREGQALGGYEVDWSRPDGSKVPVALGVSPIHDGDVVQGISIIGQDITERRRTAAALVQAREEAMESSRLKSEFLATMSHEIRTPMNGVIGLTSLLLDTDLDHSQRQFADGVQAAGDALLSVINDILDFSKLDAGKVVLDVADFDPRRLVEDVGALLAPAAFSKELELVAYCLPDVPRTVRGDPGRIRQILLNLASNAVKFTSEGEVAISVKSLPLADGQITLRFEVTDSGIGVAVEDRDRLFESFSQADASTTRRFGGTGLGLAICQRLVAVMGGHLGMESELGVGSAFWFELPLPLGDTPESILGTPAHDLLKDLRVLVVDDNATNRSILEVQLKTWQLQPDLVDSGTAALDRLRDTALRGEPYDLAVLDMFMPGMDGLQLAQAISSDPLLKGIPMIMLTSSMQLDPTALREAGIRQWLTKPMRSMELYDRLMRLMAVTDAEVRVQRPVRRPQAATGGPHSSLGRILVVEDNSLNQLVAEGILSRLGYEVRSVVNGVEALEAVESSRYAAILMDCHMPVMDGFTATAEIRRRQSNGHRIPIIAMTAGALVEDRERCLAVGMDDYISKPVNLQTLESVLARWVKPAASLGGAANGSGPSTPRPIDDRAPIDESRLESLRDLEAADGSSILASILSAFTGHSADLLVTMREAAQAGDNDRLQGIAHELRGASATAGATHVARLCAEIESAARRGGPMPSTELLDDLGMEFERAKSALARMVFSPSPLALS
ncbi:MAG TPA: response regulator [Propionibacteriaceae bacterium]|nr:response regulator [Propionibacteriaceae bacterium]